MLLNSPMERRRKTVSYRMELLARMSRFTFANLNYSLIIVFLNGPTPASFSFIFVFSNKYYNFTTNICEKISIQYTVPGFKPTTFEK